MWWSCAFCHPRSGFRTSRRSIHRISHLHRFWNTFRAVASEEILQQPMTRKAAGYRNAKRDIYCRTDSFSTGPQEKSSVSLGFCRPMSFGKHNDTILGGGHVGVEKTAAAVASQYYWRQQTDRVAEWVAGCDVCHRVKHKNARPYGLLQALLIPTEQAERINIDFITKLPAGEGGYDAVATIIDPLTKRAQWIPIKEAELTAERFAEVFIAGYVRNRGLPSSLVSD